MNDGPPGNGSHALDVRPTTFSPQDWLDTLKSHAEHRFWIGDFVKEQLQVANEQVTPSR